MHYMFGGKVKMPLTIVTRAPARGTNNGRPAFGDGSTPSLTSTIPGLKCVVPSERHTP